MTRVNLVPPEELCDQHLLAEWREITRIPNSVLTGKLKPYDIPETFRLGKGHVKFFLDKLGWLRGRYHLVLMECKRRGFNCQSYWPIGVCNVPSGWVPRPIDIEASRARIRQKMPKKPRYTRRSI